MSFVCEHCGWVGTRGDIVFRTDHMECPSCGAQTFIAVERKVTPG